MFTKRTIHRGFKETNNNHKNLFYEVAFVRAGLLAMLVLLGVLYRWQSASVRGNKYVNTSRRTLPWQEENRRALGPQIRDTLYIKPEL